MLEQLVETSTVLDVRVRGCRYVPHRGLCSALSCHTSNNRIGRAKRNLCRAKQSEHHGKGHVGDGRADGRGTRRLISYCGVPWEDEQVEHHADRGGGHCESGRADGEGEGGMEMVCVW